MIKGTTRKRTYRAIYRLLDRVSPVPFDCGRLCGAACCNAAKYDNEMGILLMPGEEKLHNKKDGWLEWELLSTDEFEFPESWRGEVNWVRCKTPPECPRSSRPLQCRTFPLWPHLTEEGILELIYNDGDLPYRCPLIEEETELDDSFIRATYTVWKHLLRDPLIFDLIEAESERRREEL